MTMTYIEALTDKALDAFWQVVVQELPHATTGDLSPLTTIQLSVCPTRGLFRKSMG